MMKPALLLRFQTKVGVLMSETVKISERKRRAICSNLQRQCWTIELDKTNWPFVDKYEGWNKTGIGSESVTYTGVNASVRNSGLANTDAYAGASGPNVVFFGKLLQASMLILSRLLTGQKNLQLTFWSQPFCEQ